MKTELQFLLSAPHMTLSYISVTSFMKTPSNDLTHLFWMDSSTTTFWTSLFPIAGYLVSFYYEGVSINNQPIPFLMDRDGHDFHALFQYMFYTGAHVLSHSLIRYWMSNMASDAKACFSSKVEYHAVIWYLYLKGKTGKEVHGELAVVYGSSAPSYAHVKFWVGEFKRGRTSWEDEARSGRPLDATDEEMCKKVRDLVYSDRRIQAEEIAKT